jgi:hypothetical protein
MSTRNSFITASIHWPSLITRMLIGTAIALMLIIFFLAGVDNPDPAWGTNWKLKPMLIVPYAGAMGGAFTYFMDPMRFHGNIARIIAALACLVGFIIALWMGSILGLNGTLWN